MQYSQNQNSNNQQFQQFQQFQQQQQQMQVKKTCHNLFQGKYVQKCKQNV